MMTTIMVIVMVGKYFRLYSAKAFVAKEPTGAREELVTDRASCRAVATSKIGF
ncbi:MAG: hypothetical protein J6S30_04450 [Kiritimatiellae bacterium]|nr:hypothetical protein [Kiritimatiellia bacterium]